VAVAGEVDILTVDHLRLLIAAAAARSTNQATASH
jgi:hypothetical protein